MVNVTIKSRKDTLSNWQTSNPVLSDGEVAVVEIPATDSTPAICLIKIGDGKTNFNTLQYMQSPAADVYAWAKKATKPEYDYSEIKNLTTMIVAGNNVTATTKDNKVTIATTQNVAKIPGTLPDIGYIEALPVWNSDEGWKRIDADALKATANTIVKRNASGQIVTAAPTANNHAANKLYVDNAATAVNINWGGLGSSAGNVTPIGAAMSDFHSANRLAFSNPAGITIEVSTDGGATWTDAQVPDAEKIKLVSGIDGYHPTIGLVYPKNFSTAGRNATANDRLRITLDAAGMGVCTQIKKMLINVSTSGAKKCKVLIERATIGAPTEFQTVIEAGVSGWSGWNDINLSGQQHFGGSASQTAQTKSLRLTFFGEGTSSSTGFLQVCNIALFGDTYWTTPSNYAKSGHLYKWDAEQNVTFPKEVRTSSVPTADNDLTNKKYVDQQAPKIGTKTNKSKLSSIEYLGEADIPSTPESGKEYAVTDFISYSDFDSDLQGKLDATATKAYVDAAVSNKQNTLTAGTGINIDSDTVKISDNVSRTSATDMGVWIPVQTRPAGSPTWSDVPVGTDEATVNSIVRRTAAGQIYTASPTANGHAATKGYVDAAVAGAGGGSSKQLLRFDGNTFAYFDNVATSAYQYTFHLRGVTAMNTGNVEIKVGQTTLFSLTPGSSNEINVDGTLMCYPASSSSSNTQHYITYSYTTSDGTCKSGYTGPSTDMRVTFNGTIGAPASGIYTNWVIREQISCTNWVGQSSDEAIDDTETI